MPPQDTDALLLFPQPPSWTPKPSAHPTRAPHASLDRPLACSVLSHDLSRVAVHAHLEDGCLVSCSVSVRLGETIGKGPSIYSAIWTSDLPLPPSPVLSPASPKIPQTALDCPTLSSAPPDRSQPNMVKKRRSLQAILIPPFFHPSHSSGEGDSPPYASQRARSQSAAATTSQYVLPPAIPIRDPSRSSCDNTPRNSPPSDLLDDDPFASLSPGPSTVVFSEPAPPPRRPSLVQPNISIDMAAVSSPRSPRVTPRSPLAQSAAELEDSDGSPLPPWAYPPAPPPPTPVPSRRAATVQPRPRSSGNAQLRPAYTRPAFSPRPSLPSLHTLAEMNIVVPKVKRGRVGAKLPAEPWSMIESSPTDPERCATPGQAPGSSSRCSSAADHAAPVQEPECYSFFDDSQENELDDHSEYASSLEPDRSTEYVHEGAVQTPTSAITQSTFDAYPPAHIPFGTFDTHASRTLEDSCSSPEPSFPPTPNLTAQAPAFSVFSQQSRNTFYDDLTATLEYDYSRAMSHFSPSPPQDAVSALTLDEGSSCDFEPGSSVQTVRAHNLREQPPSHLPSPPGQDGAAPRLPRMETLPLSSTTHADALRPSSTVSSVYDDAEFLSNHSDSSEDEFLTAPVSRSPSPTARLPRLEEPAPPVTHLPCVEDPELSESSGADIRARLSGSSFFALSDTGSSRYTSAPEHVDAGEEGSRSGRSQTQRGESSAQGGSTGRHFGAPSGTGSGRTGGMGFGGGSGGGRRDRDGDDDRYRRPQPRTSAPDYTSEETSSDEDSSDDEDAATRQKSSRRRGRSSSSSEDDDVPLAQQIPTALRAQRTIRRQVRDEAVQKRRARSLRRPGPSEPPTTELPPIPTQRVTPERSASRPPSASRAAPAPQEPPKPIGRPRTKTLPSQMGGSPFAMGELTRKLLNVQAAPPLPQAPPVSARASSQDAPQPQSPKQASSRIPSQHDQHAIPRPSMQDGDTALRLRSMRSFHRPRTTGGESELPPVPFAGAQLGRSNTGATRRAQPPDSQPAPALPPHAAGGLERAKSSRSHSRRPSLERSARPSLEHDARPPVPPMPAPVAKMPAWQQRVFVGTLQRFCQVEITATSTARDVLEILQNQAALDDGAANGWMMWEVSQDFGMERPIRSFEVLSDVTNSWVSNKTVNVLMAKKTLLAPKLSRAAIPSSSPVCGGFVQWEYKRGKWQKRWLELREHSLWLSKRDTGKDQVQLCSLNNFDAYIVTRISKAPKAYVFAVKSTDNISFFESTSDYVHVFSCDQKEGENWVEKILIARSYILYQDRNVLSTTANAGASLSRSGTRKRPAQPLVNFSGAQSASTEPPPAVAPVFMPGSLLAKSS